MEDIPPGKKVITVCDREGDMYELFAKAQSMNKPVLVRIVRNRMTAENKRILDEIRKKRCQGIFKILGSFLRKFEWTTDDTLNCCSYTFDT
jgi:hypothetical protein